MRKKAALILVAGVCGICLIVYLAHRKEPVYDIPRQVQYGFTLRNTTNQVIESAVFQTWAPVRKTSFQTCEKINANYPFTIHEDEYGNQILRFEIVKLPPFGMRIITITTVLRLSMHSNPIDIGDSRVWLEPQKYLESDHPDIIKTTQTLKADATGKTVENIFHWVASNIRYTGYARDARGALYALQHQNGDCTEFMYLFTALCRASRIPSRAMGGYVCENNMILKPAGYHNWAEFNVEGKWQVADPQNNVLQKNAYQYLVMRIITDPIHGSAERFERFHANDPRIEATMN